MFKNWWRSQPAFGKTPGAARGEPAPRRLHDRHLARPEDAGDRHGRGDRQGAHRQLVRARRWSRSQPGTGTDQGDGGEPDATAWTRATTARTPTDAKRRPASRATTRTRSTPLLGGGDMPGYQAGSTFKIFTMLAALDMGLPLNTKIIRAACRYVRSTSPAPASPARCGGRLVPAQRQRGHDRRADHVVRLRQVGQHVLRPAGAAGRRRERRCGWPSGSGLTWHTDVDQLHGLAGAGQRLGLVHPRRGRHHAAGDGQRVRHPGRRRQVTARPSPVLSHHRLAAGQAGRRPRRRNCQPGGPAGGGPGRGRRHPLRHRLQARPPAAAAAGPPRPACTAAVGRPVARQDRHHRRHPGGLVRRLHPDLAAASFIADPDNPFHSPATGTRRNPSTPSPACCAGAWPERRSCSSRHPTAVPPTATPTSSSVRPAGPADPPTPTAHRRRHALPTAPATCSLPAATPTARRLLPRPAP